MKRLLMLEILAITFIIGLNLAQPIQKFQEEDLAKTTSQDDVNFLDVRWGSDLLTDGSLKSIKVFLDVKHKVYIKISIDEDDLCYQKHNPEVYSEGNFGCNEECNIGECEEYELLTHYNIRSYFFINRDRIVKVCWLRSSDLDFGTNTKYKKCETKVLNKID